jgi:CRISPR-associated protein Csm5
MRGGEWLHLEVKSPLFIGDGDVLTPLSYVADRGKVYAVNPARFLKGLSEVERQAYIKWLEPILDEMEQLQARIRETSSPDQRSFLQRQHRQVTSSLSLGEFIRQQFRRDPISVVRKLNCIAYIINRATFAGGNIRTFIKNADGSPFIPGTEIKGAIRTSLLYALLKEEPSLYKGLQNKLTDLGRYLRSGTKPQEKVKRLRGVSREVERIARGEKDDARFDFLKFIQVGDATLPSDSLDVQTLESIGTGRRTRTAAEGIRVGAQTEARLVITPGAECAMRKLGLEKFQGFLTTERLFEAIYSRSKDVLSDTAQYFKGYPRIQSHIHELERANKPQSPLLRLGWGQGFLSTTINLLVREKDKQLYEDIWEGISLQRRQRTTPGNFPKTRRVVSDGRGNPLALPGWVELSKQ